LDLIDLNFIIPLFYPSDIRLKYKTILPVLFIDILKYKTILPVLFIDILKYKTILPVLFIDILNIPW